MKLENRGVTGQLWGVVSPFLPVEYTAGSCEWGRESGCHLPTQHHQRGPLSSHSGHCLEEAIRGINVLHLLCVFDFLVKRIYLF